MNLKKILEQQKNPNETITFSLNKEELLQYAIEHNISDIDILLKAIEQAEKNKHNEEMKMDEDLKTQIINLYTDIKKDVRQLRTEFSEMKKDFRILKADVKATKWILGLLITIFGSLTPILMTMQNYATDAKFEALNTKYESIIQEIRGNKELNQPQIERDVIKEVSKQTKH